MNKFEQGDVQVCNFLCVCKSKYIFYFKQTHLYFSKFKSVKMQWIVFLRMSHVQQIVLC